MDELDATQASAAARGVAMQDRTTGHIPTRQWQITLTEGPSPGVYRASVRWRTFPCAATEWDGARTGSILSLGPRIRSVDDAQAVLSLFVDVDLSPLSRQATTAPPEQV